MVMQCIRELLKKASSRMCTPLPFGSILRTSRRQRWMPHINNSRTLVSTDKLFNEKFTMDKNTMHKIRIISTKMPGKWT